MQESIYVNNLHHQLILISCDCQPRTEPGASQSSSPLEVPWLGHYQISMASIQKQHWQW